MLNIKKMLDKLIKWTEIEKYQWRNVFTCAKPAYRINASTKKMGGYFSLEPRNDFILLTYNVGYKKDFGRFGSVWITLGEIFLYTHPMAKAPISDEIKKKVNKLYNLVMERIDSNQDCFSDSEDGGLAPGITHF